MQRERFFGNVRSDPQWAGDAGRGNYIGVQFPAKLDPTQFSDAAGFKIIVGSAGAAANATSIPIGALTLPLSAGNIAIQGSNMVIPAGTTLSFGPVGSKKFARLTVAANLGDTTLTVEALPTALVSTDTAIWSPYGTKTIPSGTILGRTYTERDANTPFGAAIDTDDEIYLQLFDIPDANIAGGDDVEIYRHGLVVKENYLPNYSAISGALLIKLRAAYNCIKGVD